MPHGYSHMERHQQTPPKVEDSDLEALTAPLMAHLHHGTKESLGVPVGIPRLDKTLVRKDYLRRPSFLMIAR